MEGEGDVGDGVEGVGYEGGRGVKIEGDGEGWLRWEGVGGGKGEVKKEKGDGLGRCGEN